MGLIYDIVLHRGSNNKSEDNVNQGMKDYSMGWKSGSRKDKAMLYKAKAKQ